MKVTVWNENIHEKEEPKICEIYPGGLHGFIASFLREDDVEVRVATLDEDECGLTDEVLKDTDVLIWWGHVGHDKVPDEVVDRVQRYVLAGMGFIALHSAHHSKIFRRLMGTTGNLKWNMNREERVRLWNLKPNHPICEGIPETFSIGNEEMYGEAFDIPEPMELIFISWYSGGNVFRSGCTWTRGNGKIFYFQPGHETAKALHNEYVQKVIKNAVRWACPIKKNFELICPRFEELEN